MTLVSYDEERRYTLAEIEIAVVALEARFPTRKPKKAAQRSDKKALTADNDNLKTKPDFEVVAAGCAWAKFTVDSAATLPEPDWYAQAGIVGHCENGREEFHRMSEPHPGYSREEADRKLDQAMAAADPRACDNIRDALGCIACHNCLFAGRIRSPIALGYHNKAVVELIASHVVDVETVTYQAVDR